MTLRSRGPDFRQAGRWRSGESICEDLSSNLQESQLEGFPQPVYRVVMSQKKRSRGFPQRPYSLCLVKQSSPLSLSFLLSLPVKLWDQLQGVRPQEQQGQRTQHCGLTPCVRDERLYVLTTNHPHLAFPVLGLTTKINKLNLREQVMGDLSQTSLRK